MPTTISAELYRRYRDPVWELTNWRQRWEPDRVLRGLTDEEIASRLGLSAAEVAEIRCIAETEMIPLGDYLGAEESKERRFRSLRRGGGVPDEGKRGPEGLAGGARPHKSR